MTEEAAARLHAFLEKARAKHKPGEAVVTPFPAEDPVVVELVRSFLTWESGSGFAERTLARIRDHVVDFNELRVFLPDEIAAMMGDDPRAQERAERMRATLNEVYAREHDMRLSHLAEEGKRDTRAYLDTLDGMHSFVAARVSLLCFSGHAFPIDARLRDALARGKVVPAEQPPSEVAGWVERQVRAGEALPNYQALEALVESQAPKPSARAKAGAKRASTRKPAEPRARKSVDAKVDSKATKPSRRSTEN